MSEQRPEVAIGIDIGGTGIKGALVHLATGELLGTRQKRKTPKGAPIGEVLDAVAQLRDAILAQPEATMTDYPIGMCMPTVVRRGVAYTAANIAPEWIGFPAAAAFSQRLGQRISLMNDADAAGYGEVQFGQAKDAAGLVIVVTLGTGIGSALIYNGSLVPNTELGHLELNGHGDYERYASAKVRERQDIPLKAWAEERLTPYFQKLEQLFAPDLFIVSGGISKRAAEFLPHIAVTTRIDAAQLVNNAGIVGAALLARRGWQ